MRLGRSFDDRERALVVIVVRIVARRVWHGLDLLSFAPAVACAGQKQSPPGGPGGRWEDTRACGAPEDRRGGGLQCDIRIGMWVRESTSRVTPPSSISENRECS